jgi:SPP1 gp7 family putative phage head morphogenesis protein
MPPLAIERRYYKAVLGLINEMDRQVKKILLPKLPNIVAQANRLKPISYTDVSNLDNYDDELWKLFQLIRTGFFSQYSDDDILDITSQIGRAVASENGRAINTVYKGITGVDIFISEPWLKPELAIFANANVSLIKTLSERHFSAIELMVTDGIQRGLRHEEIAKALQDGPFSATPKQAALIARDQVSKLNGQLTELRQKQAGISRYIWRTVGDERVRESHQELDGQIFSWDDPPEVGHPGYDYQCRCYAEPVIEDLLEES